jgi:NAD(P)-dependent dehydrogenase (short-subunit alcohol dehydrogenase family)
LPSTVPFVGPEVQERTWRRVQGTDRRLKRVGDPDEIAGLVAYLASGESGYMTGSSLTIDGGMAL